MEHLTLPQAAREARVSETTIRRWIQRENLPAAKDSDGNWHISSSDFATHLAKREERKTVGASATPSVLASNLASATEASKLLEKTLEREQKINDELREELREVRSENKALQEELKRLLQQGQQDHLVKPEAMHETEEPKTEFGKKCLDLFRSGKTDHEISQILGKPIQNVKAALASYRHSALQHAS